MWAWFCIQGVTADEFRNYLRKQGARCMIGAGEHFCLTVLAMGWSWAPFLAHSALTDILDDIHGDAASDKRIIYGRPVSQPSFPVSAQDHPTTWAYIDDFGALVLPAAGETEEDETRARAGAWDATTREGMARRGLPVHKEAVGEGISAILGACVLGRPIHSGATTISHDDADGNDARALGPPGGPAKHAREADRVLGLSAVASKVRLRGARPGVPRDPRAGRKTGGTSPERGPTGARYLGGDRALARDELGNPLAHQGLRYRCVPRWGSVSQTPRPQRRRSKRRCASQSPRVGSCA